MDISKAYEHLREHHRAVLLTYRRDAGPQLSPVVCVPHEDGAIEISSRETAMKTKNVRRDPRASLCVMTDSFFGPWVQVDGKATVVSLPAAMDGLIDYYRRLAGEHPDWDDYRSAMQEEKRVLLRLSIERAGPDRSG
jgi:PPOX class probable F420-dependent enzyme